jgi:hypothetical protein
MRPARFQHLLALAVDNDGQMVATTYAEAGITTSLYGLILTGGPTEAKVHIAARSALGDDYAQPEHIVSGDEHASLTVVKPDDLNGVERYLAALIVDVAANEIASVRLYHLRDSKQANSNGFTVNFHDGSAIFVYVTEGT